MLLHVGEHIDHTVRLTLYTTVPLLPVYLPCCGKRAGRFFFHNFELHHENVYTGIQIPHQAFCQKICLGYDGSVARAPKTQSPRGGLGALPQKNV
jgi:hypothetical protein